MKKSILVIAGEVSGDLHASKVVRQVKIQFPETVFWGIGGDKLQAEGVEVEFKGLLLSPLEKK